MEAEYGVKLDRVRSHPGLAVVKVKVKVKERYVRHARPCAAKAVCRCR
jgi:hypothetical protein